MSQIPLPLPDHDTDLVGDTLMSVSLNFRWRRLIAPLLIRLLNPNMFDGSEAQIDTAIQQVHALLSDLYTERAAGVTTFSGAQIVRTSTWTITTVPTAIDWQTIGVAAGFDTDGFWDIGTPSRLTIPAGMHGYYRVAGYIPLAGGAAAVITRIGLNGTIKDMGSDETNSDHIQALQPAGGMALADGDYIEIIADTVTGTRLISSVFGEFDALISLVRLGDIP